MKCILTFFCFHFILTSSFVQRESIYSAFSEVFQLKDQISDGTTPVLRQAVLELEKMGVDGNLTNVCELDSETLARILMKAALGEYILGLRDPNDWSVVVANAETGQLVRQRSFSATRFAVIESLLLISIVALGRVLWLK
jgi:hypothetical protein